MSKAIPLSKLETLFINCKDEELFRYAEELERENAELKQQITLLSGVFSREEELQAHITELKRIIAESKEQNRSVLADWDDLLEDLEIHGMHSFEPYIKSKKKFAQYELKDTK